MLFNIPFPGQPLSIVLHAKVKLIAFTPSVDFNPAGRLGGSDAMANSIFDERLQKQIRNQSPTRPRTDIDPHLELFAVPGLLDGYVTAQEINFLLQGTSCAPSPSNT